MSGDHIQIVLLRRSSEAEATRVPSAENATMVTVSMWPSNVETISRRVGLGTEGEDSRTGDFAIDEEGWVTRRSHRLCWIPFANRPFPLDDHSVQCSLGDIFFFGSPSGMVTILDFSNFPFT